MRHEGGGDEPEAGQGAARDVPASWMMEADRARLDNDRAAGAQSLQALDAPLDDLDAAPGPAAADAALGERLHLLTELDPEMRTQLHIITGYLQLLRLEPGSNGEAAHRLDAALAAGSRLLEKIRDVNLLSDKDAAFLPARIEAGAGRPAAPAGTRALEVLVADDIEMNRDIAAALLRGAGHRVHLAEDGAGALLMATTLDFDAILMDVRMPGIDGLEATRRIRRLRGARGAVPIIALTARVSPEEVAACRDAGMNGHLAKPFRHETLTEAVARAAALRPGIACAPAGDAIGGRAGGLDAGRLRALIAPPAGTVAARSPGGAPWIDIEGPWSALQAVRQRDASMERAGPPGSSHIAIELRRERQGGQGNLADPRRTCSPPDDLDQHEYHWLLFVEPGTVYPDRFSTECELWRWCRGGWRSVAVPGAGFSPMDMYRDGWRYGGACDNAIARVEVGGAKA
jgi:CheY-like chemotaxis protein